MGKLMDLSVSRYILKSLKEGGVSRDARDGLKEGMLADASNTDLWPSPLPPCVPPGLEVRAEGHCPALCVARTQRDIAVATCAKMVIALFNFIVLGRPKHTLCGTQLKQRLTKEQYAMQKRILRLSRSWIDCGHWARKQLRRHCKSTRTFNVDYPTY